MQSVFRGALVGLMAGLLCGTAAAQSWQPTKTVEFIVPAGTGGGADQLIHGWGPLALIDFLLSGAPFVDVETKFLLEVEDNVHVSSHCSFSVFQK